MKILLLFAILILTEMFPSNGKAVSSSCCTL